MELHTKLHTSGLEVHKCTQCTSKFITFNRLSKHLEQEHGEKITNKKFQCSDCPKVYNQKCSLMIHAAASNHSTHLLEGKTPHKCKYCLKPHLRIRDLWKHEKVHEAQGDQSINDGEDISFNYTASSKVEFKCNVCEKTFASKIAAEVHAVARNHMEGYEYLQPLSCGQCKKKFARKRELMRHMDGHAADKFICEICGKKCSSDKALRTHNTLHSQFICCHCKKPMSNEAALVTHVINEHSDQPGMIKCNFCVKYVKVQFTIILIFKVYIFAGTLLTEINFESTSNL